MSGPVICSKFDPSHTYLAQAVQALDTHQVKVQSVVLLQELLNTTFTLAKGAKLTTLEWVSSDILALCHTNGSIALYRPASNSIDATLESPLNLEIADFHVSPVSHTGWAADINGNIFEWDLHSHKLVQQFSLGEMVDSSERISRLLSVLYENEPHLLVGTHNVYLVDVFNKHVVKTFPAHVQPLHTLFPLAEDPDLFVTAADGDRFANIYSISKNSTKAVLVAQSPIHNVVLALQDAHSVAAVVVENGSLELFHDPLVFDVAAPETPISKKKRRQAAGGVRSRHLDASVRFSRPADEIRTPDDENLYIHALAAADNVVHVSWTENGTVARFDSVVWHNESGFVFSGAHVVTEAKQALSVPKHTQNGHDVAAPKLYNEHHTVVTEGNAFQHNVESENDDESLAEKLEKLAPREKLGKKKLSKHTAGTLTVVLSQALRNNDHGLLETVLTNRDPAVVQNTISRLHSSLAVVLLDRLAERITRQQLRFDQLNYWLKWIVIIHGGVLSSMPNMKSQLASLHAILTKKASTLPRLLELQGRLSMLHLQSELKREIMKGTVVQDDYDDADTDVEYVEEVDDAVESGYVDSEGEMEIDVDSEMEMESEGEIDVDGMVDDFEEGLSDVETAVEHEVFE